MSARSIVLLGLKIVVLAAVYFVALMAGNILFVAPAVNLADVVPEQAAGQMRGYIIIALVDTLIIAMLALRSRWTGWRLALAICFSLYGVMTFLAQVETAWFAPALTTMQITPALLLGLFLQTIPAVLIVVPLAVLLLGRWRTGVADLAEPPSLPATFGSWAWRLAVIIVAYELLYFGFGWLVAWQNPDVRALYAEGANPVVFDRQRLIPFQALRALLWVAFALPVIRMTRGAPWQIGLVVGLLFALPMNIVHVLPNPLMSPSVQLSHFIETATSNLIFGWLLTELLLWRPSRAARPLTPQAHAR